MDSNSRYLARINRLQSDRKLGSKGGQVAVEYVVIVCTVTFTAILLAHGLDNDLCQANPSLNDQCDNILTQIAATFTDLLTSVAIIIALPL